MHSETRSYRTGSDEVVLDLTQDAVEFDAVVRIDTPGEANYYRNGGIMQYVLRNLRAQSA